MTRRISIAAVFALAGALVASARSSTEYTVPTPKGGPKNPTINMLEATDGRAKRSKGERKRNKRDRWS